ncbi:MAG: head GIN domain-containing protein [Bacteroidota bacterium]
MKHIKLVALLALIIGTSSCERALWDSGDLIVEDRSLAEFYTGLDVDGNIDVIITSNDSYDVRVETGSRKIKHIVTEVIDEVLYVYEERNNVADDKQTKVFIDQEFLDKINLDGSGDISAQALESADMDINVRGSGDIDLRFLEVNSVDASIRGSGDIVLSGEGESVNFDIDGSGDIDALDLPVEFASVLIDGSGDVSVNVSNELNVVINGSGDVNYLGSPIVSTEINGSGDVGPL